MLANLQNRFESLTTREKIIVVATLLAGIWSLWDKFFYQSVNNQQMLLTQDLQKIAVQLDAQNKTIIQLETNTYIDPNLANQNKLDTLKQQYEQLQEQMMLGDKKFVPPQIMSHVLHDILNQNSALSLINLDTLPISKLVSTSQEHPIYKHGLALTFNGNYLDTLKLLKALENLPWVFLWDTIDYQVKTYPNAEISIKAYTLSFEESWLGI